MVKQDFIKYINQNQKRERICNLLESNPEKSDRQIANQLGVGHPIVGKVRRKMESENLIPVIEKRVGLDGKRYLPDSNKKEFKSLFEMNKVNHTYRVVYFIQCQTTKLIKIGVAEDLMHRVSSLATICPTKLKVLATIKGSYKEENLLHSKFQHLRDHGEWFKPGKDLLKYIKEAA